MNDSGNDSGNGNGSGSDTPALARILARDFAVALEHLQTAWDVHYVPAGMADLPSPAVVATGASPTTTAPSAATRAITPTPEAAAAAVAAEPDKQALRQQAETWSAATKLDYLRRKNLGDCKRCGLCQTRTNIVFGVGNPEADIMFVGEAPGADEDRQGEPFVGRAGKLLDHWLAALGLARGDVYIANVLKCRPPGNRDPRPEEVDRCSPFLKAQIRAISPRVIVALGRHAGMLLSRREEMTLRAMRNSRLSYDATAKNDAPGSRSIPLVVTYHPAYVLRQEQDPSQPGPATEAVMADLRRALEVATARASG